MKNADLPDMPQSVAQTLDSGMVASYDFVGGMGLTKREYFAGLAMQGLCFDMGGYTIDGLAKDAVSCADALIAELEKDI